MADAPDRPPFILASASPRRRDLLATLGIVPDDVIAADLDESVRPDELPKAHAVRLAGAKLEAVLPRASGAFVLAADTVVGVGRRILPKTEDHAAAETCLRLMSGRRHRVYTAMAIAAPDGRIAARTGEAIVTFKRLGEAEIRAYLASGEWQGKAGGYGIQGKAGAFVQNLIGSYTAVVGLCVHETAKALAGLGYPLWKA